MKAPIFEFTLDNGMKVSVKMYKGTSVFHWNSWMYKHRVFVTYDGKTATFLYYDHSERVKAKDLKDVLDAIISDASYGNLPYMDFCDEMGYDCFEEEKEASKVHTGCFKAMNKLEYIGLREPLRIEISNKLWSLPTP